MSGRIKDIFNIIIFALILGAFAIWEISEADEEYSKTERRVLADMPEMNVGNILNGSFMTDWEEYVLDQFPMRNEFISAKAFTLYNIFNQKDNNGVYVQDGYMSKIEYPYSISDVLYATGRFETIYEKYIRDTDSHVYLSIIPDKNYYIAEAGGYPVMNYDMLINDTKSKMSYAKYIDITKCMGKEDYYATDTHWRQEKIYDVAQVIAENMGIKLSADYEKNKLNVPFYGVYYSQLGLYSYNPDELYYMTADYFDDCTVYDYETESVMPLYDMEKAYGRDAYEMFLSGAKALIEIKNPKASTDKSLIVFRDSFAGSITPYFMEGYSKIILVDIRYISLYVLGSFINFENSDVLFLYSTLVLNNSENLH